MNFFINHDRNNRLSEKGKFSDKLKAKNYVSENLPFVKIAKTLFCTKNPEELRNVNLPNNFVLKNSSGSQMNIIIKNNNYNLEKLISKSKIFLNTKYSSKSYRAIPFINCKEKQYDYNDPTIMIEEYLNGEIQDLKFHLIKGKIAFIQIDNERDKNHQRNLYDENLNLLNYKVKYLSNFKEKIKISTENLELCKKFCNIFYSNTSFDFVRIDFFLYNNDIYFSEFTFTPGNCMLKYSGDFENYIYNKYIK